MIGTGGHSGRTVTVKIKYADFRQITRSRSCVEPIGSQKALEEIGLELLKPHFPPPLGCAASRGDDFQFGDGRATKPGTVGARP